MYDLIVIGAGSGGLAAARRARKHGANVLLIEKKDIGGTCVNLGCVPKKITYNFSNMIDFLKYYKEYGIMNVGEIDKDGVKDNKKIYIDWELFKTKRDNYIKKLNDIYYRKIEESGIEYLKGEARLLCKDDENVVKVYDNEFKAKNILLATGSEATLLDVPGSEFLSTSDDFFYLKKLPKSAVIIGSGYISVELAFMLNSLGTKVRIIARNNILLSHFDKMIGENVLEEMKKREIKVHFNCKLTEVKRKPYSPCGSHIFDVHCDENGTKIELNDIDFVLCAVGRHSSLNYVEGYFEKEGAFIKIDENFQTSKKDIYAIGDMANPKHMLTPVAIFCGRILADHLFMKKQDLSLVKTFGVYDCIPSVVFSHPPCATIGLTEENARKNFADVKVYQSTFIGLFFSVSDIKEKTVYKIITGDKKVVGLHIIGMGSDEVIQGFAVAMKMGATYEDFKRTICVHPTSAEELLTMD